MPLTGPLLAITIAVGIAILAFLGGVLHNLRAAYLARLDRAHFAAPWPQHRRDPDAESGFELRSASQRGFYRPGDEWGRW